MSDARSEHEKLVEDAARAQYDAKHGGGAWDDLTASAIYHAFPTPTASQRPYIESARAGIAFILSRFHDVTPEMVEAASEAIWQQESQRVTGRLRLTAWVEEGNETRERYRGLARAAISGAQSASPLNGGK